MKPRPLNDEQGNSLVETALTLSILLSVLFGILEVCLGMYFYNFTCESARLATRFAMVRGSTCSGLSGGCPAYSADIDSYVRSLNYPAIDVSAKGPLTVTTTPDGPFIPGQPVTVRVQYKATLPIPFTTGINVTLSSTSQEVISQ